MKIVIIVDGEKFLLQDIIIRVDAEEFLLQEHSETVASAKSDYRIFELQFRDQVFNFNFKQEQEKTLQLRLQLQLTELNSSSGTASPTSVDETRFDINLPVRLMPRFFPY